MSTSSTSSSSATSSARKYKPIKHSIESILNFKSQERGDTECEEYSQDDENGSQDTEYHQSQNLATNAKRRRKYSIDRPDDQDDQ